MDTEPQEGRCSSCGASILWVKTPAGAKMPLDAEGQRRVVLGKHTGLGHVLMTYTTNWATCPSADEHRYRQQPGDAPQSPEAEGGAQDTAEGAPEEQGRTVGQEQPATPSPRTFDGKSRFARGRRR